MPRKPPTGPHVVDGRLTQAVIDWILDSDRETESNIGSVLSGQAQAQAIINARLAAEEAARAAGDQALAGSGDGTGTTDSDAWYLATTSAATWVTASTLMVTPTGAGTYTFSFSAAEYSASTNPAPTTAPTTFNGNWRIVEEESAGGTPVTLRTGAFTVQSFPEQAVEGGVLPAYSLTEFTGSMAPVASNYTVLTDLRLELQRASGSNEAINLSGTFGVNWA